MSVGTILSSIEYYIGRHVGIFTCTYKRMFSLTTVPAMTDTKRKTRAKSAHPREKSLASEVVLVQLLEFGTR